MKTLHSPSMNIINISKTAIFPAIALVTLLIACNKDEALPASGNKILIGDTVFKTYPNDPLNISAAAIDGDSLQITFGARCCDGQSWKVQLVGSGVVMLSYPPQLAIRLSLKDDEVCKALCSKTMKFDLTPARVSGNQIVLNLAGWNQSLLYKY
jgi:hypothetical protein